MATTSSTATSYQHNQRVQKYSSGSEEASDQQVMDFRKRKRMLSNRESARRSRLRKQKHLDDLTAQVNQLRSQNGQILATISATTQLYVNIEAENSILRAQMGELDNRLKSLNDIIHCLSHVTTTPVSVESDDQVSFGSFDLDFDDGFPINSWGFPLASHSVMAGPDAFMC